MFMFLWKRSKRENIFHCTFIDLNIPKLSSAAALCFSLRLCSDWSAHTRLSQQCSQCLQLALSCFLHPISFTSTRNITINCAVVSHGDAVRVRNKAVQLMRRLRCSVFGDIICLIILTDSDLGSPTTTSQYSKLSCVFGQCGCQISDINSNASTVVSSTGRQCEHHPEALL